MPGKRLNSQARDLVAKLIDYFTAERDNGGPLISLNAVQERVSDALGISIRTVSSIKMRSERNEVLSTPGKSRPRIKAKSENLSENKKFEVRNVIHDMYAEKKPVTLRNLKEELATKHILNASIGTISKLLTNLGFKYKQEDNRRTLIERTSIALMRNDFLRKYMNNRNSAVPRQIVFVDETWIFAKGSQIKSWQDESTKSVRKAEGYDGKRFIVLHAGHSNGFVANAQLIYSPKSKLADYHGDMSGDIFMKWLEEKLIPNLEEPSLIIMDNVPYHSMQLEKQPTSTWNKTAIVEWLEKSNITFDKNLFKAELLQLAKRYRKPTRYKVDELLQQHGHEVLRLPPYHCHFNAFEMIWANAKNFYNKHIGEDGYGDDKVLDMWQKALEKYTPEVWSSVVNHTDKLIQEWYNREHIIDNIPKIIINVNGNDSDSDSESDSSSSNI